MRLGVLDVGSNTVHLIVVDARPGGKPSPMEDWKVPLRLVSQLDSEGNITPDGQATLINAIQEAKRLSQELNCEEFLPIATSAIRSATNGEQVLAEVAAQTGVTLTTVSGEEEARLTFLAVRRWYGWNAGRIMDLDIGGGSLELSTGVTEEPDAAFSVELGANRLTNEWFDTDPPSKKAIHELRDYIDETLREPAAALRAYGKPNLAVGTSKTFRTLARLTGAAPSSKGPYAVRTLSQPAIRQLIAFISRMTAADRAELEGLTSDRAEQIVAGALVAEASMRTLGLEQLQMCPWALREGVILRRIEKGV
ncbi:MAG: Ppx/GppA phosphatase family protein [Corynebacterium sp.]|nr:Ppx/GppA phosphatase family protein [Corynebacterium sp.]